MAGKLPMAFSHLETWDTVICVTIKLYESGVRCSQVIIFLAYVTPRESRKMTLFSRMKAHVHNDWSLHTVGHIGKSSPCSYFPHIPLPLCGRTSPRGLALSASPASSQPSPSSITHQQHWTTGNHCSCCPFWREYLLFISPSQPVTWVPPVHVTMSDSGGLFSQVRCSYWV